MIFCDLDDVLADFTGAACRIHDKPLPLTWGLYTEWGMSREDFWEPINNLGDEFYAEYVKPLPWVDQLLDACKRADNEFAILTAPGDNWPGLNGKKEWINRYVGSDVEVILCHHKHLLAAPGRLLIDDKYENCLHFAMFGGASILFPRPTNTKWCKPHDSWLMAMDKIRDWGRECRCPQLDLDGAITLNPEFSL